MPRNMPGGNMACIDRIRIQRRRVKFGEQQRVVEIRPTEPNELRLSERERFVSLRNPRDHLFGEFNTHNLQFNRLPF